jgi:hypothetical protein
MNQHNHSSSNDGFVVLITVLILSIVLSTVAVFLLLTGSNASITSLSVDGGVESRAAATGCAELALSAIQANPTLTTPANGSQTLNTALSETCTYSISGTSPNYTILAAGTVKQPNTTIVHNMTVTTSQTTPSITIASWQDTP